MTYVKLRTGTLPFEQTQSGRIVEAQLAGRLDLKSLPEREREVIAQAASRNPQARYPSCVALIDALEAVCEKGVAVLHPAPSVPEQTPIEEPDTHRPKSGGPTPAEGPARVPAWQRQGRSYSDRTLIPGLEPTRDRLEMPVVEVKKTAAPQPLVDIAGKRRHPRRG
jgi:hypothetical protein